MVKERPALAAALVAASFASAALAQSVSCRTLALTGDPAPGLEGLTFEFLADPVLRPGSPAELIFWGDLAGAGVTPEDDGSVWRLVDGAGSLVVREGDPAPYDSDVRFAAFAWPALNVQGLIQFTASLVTPGIGAETNLGIFRQAEGPRFLVVAREGEASPGFGEDFIALPVAPFAADGSTGFAAATTNIPGAGVWSDHAGALSLVALRGDALPGMPDGAGAGYFDNPAQNAAGDLAYRASIVEVMPEGDQVLGFGVYVSPGAGTPQALALTGQQAPGLPAGVVFGSPAISPVVFDDGSVAFWSSLMGEGVDASNDAGIWTGMPGGLVLAAREGDAAPGTDAVFGALTATIVPAAGGKGAFTAQLAGEGVTPETNASIWRLDGSEASLVAREGDPVPGLDGAVFHAFSNLAPGDDGSVAFIAVLRGDSIEPASNTGLFRADAAGSIVMVARTGDAYDVRGDGSDLRTITDIVLAHGSGLSGRSAVAPDTIAFKAYFGHASHALIAATFEAACPADCNGDGALNIFDFLCFQGKVTTGDPAADCNGDGSVNIFDFLCFQGLVTQGCP
jgi:hypothetical protein